MLSATEGWAILLRPVVLWLRKIPAGTNTLMQRTPLVYATLLAAGLMAGSAALDAQQPAAGPSPDYRKPIFRVDGIGVSSVAGLPFSATVVVGSDRIMSDGSVLTLRTVILIARDSKGRTHNEIRRLEPESFHGSPEVMQVLLFDPETRLSTIYYPATHLARIRMIPVRPKSASLPNPWTSQEDLGTDTLNGLEAKGVRRVFSVPADGSGGKPVEVVDEIWRSAELHLDLLKRHTDPRVGENTLAVSNLKREEPPASMFELPAGYTIVNPIPPPGPAPARNPAREADPMADELP